MVALRAMTAYAEDSPGGFRPPDQPCAERQDHSNKGLRHGPKLGTLGLKPRPAVA